jgi:hypothetical protein
MFGIVRDDLRRNHRQKPLGLSIGATIVRANFLVKENSKPVGHRRAVVFVTFKILTSPRKSRLREAERIEPRVISIGHQEMSEKKLDVVDIWHKRLFATSRCSQDESSRGEKPSYVFLSLLHVERRKRVGNEITGT